MLRFYARSKLPEYPHGKNGYRKFIICFFLADNSLEVRDVRDSDEARGAGTFPKFIKRQRLAKTRDIILIPMEAVNIILLWQCRISAMWMIKIVFYSKHLVAIWYLSMRPPGKLPLILSPQ